MSLGATMSAPARACDSASRASSSSVASLSTSPFASTPQWPWTVYSHMQTSVITTSCGSSRLSARTACCTGPSSSHALGALGVLVLGDAEQQHAADALPPRPRVASRSSSSTDVCDTPGIDETGVRTPCPARTNSGSTSCDGASTVSRTRVRSASVRRRRRGR